MVEEDRYCIDVVTQIQAARAALSTVETELLRAHIAHCLNEAAASGNAAERAARIEELMRVLPRLTRG